MGLFDRWKKNGDTQKSDPRTEPFLRLMELTREIHEILDVDRALQVILDGALELTKMQRGFIMLYDDDERLTFRLGRTSKQETLKPDDFQVSSTMIEKAIQQRDLCFFNNITDTLSSSAARLQIMCGLCVPLFASRAVSGIESSRKIIGTLYADSRVPVQMKQEQREIVNSLALHAGLSLENASLFDLAVRDGLTRLYQRRYFDSLASIEWKRAQRHKRPLSALLFDLDNFKSINDTYGHDQGDRVIRETAEVLRVCGRAEDVVARYGGEEFAMLLPETDERGAELVASRIVQSISRNIRVRERIVTISAGTATVPFCGAEKVDGLIKCADDALYRAKARGRNRVESAQPAAPKAD